MFNFDTKPKGVCFIEPEGVEKIKILIEKWGSRATETVSIETDFVVLGNAPRIPQKPTFEEMELYPKLDQALDERQKKHIIDRIEQIIE